MEMGLIELSRTGVNTTLRRTAAGPRIVVFDREQSPVAAMVMVAGAIASDVPCTVIALSLLERRRSGVSDSPGNKMLADIRNKFGSQAIQRS
jgi:6-phosphogluconate dehydrogenase (decarboxylating)